MTDDAVDYAVKRTGDFVEGAALGTRFSGDHINALCRAIAQARLRNRSERPCTPEDIDLALTEWLERPRLTPAEERVIATHEAGHAVCALFCSHAPPIERISIRADTAGALGFVRYQDSAHRYVVTRGELLDDLCVLMGGREAEQLLLEDLSIGSVSDLHRATTLARALVEEFGLGGESVGVGRFVDDAGRRLDQSPAQSEALDKCIRQFLDEARAGRRKSSRKIAA